MKKIILAIFAFILISCERNVDAELPYKEQVVISSMLYSNTPLFINLPLGINSFVHIGRTIPSLEYPDTNNSLIKDADVSIISDNQSYQLKYKSMGFWVNDDFIPEVGKNYRIEVMYKNNLTYAETYIPEVEYEFGDVSRKIIVEDFEWGSITNEYYFITLKYYNKSYPLMLSDIISTENNNFKSNNSFLYTNFEINKDYNINFYYSTIDDTTIVINEFIVGFDFFDPAIKLFWDTKHQGQEEFGIFGGGGLNRKGNIQNGIGYFYGSNFIIDTLRYE